MRIGTKEVEETAEGEHREPRGFSPALRTPTFNTQVEKKQAKEVRMKRKKREKPGKLGTMEAKRRVSCRSECEPWKTLGKTQAVGKWKLEKNVFFVLCKWRLLLT